MNKTAWEDLYPGWDLMTLESTGIIQLPDYLLVLDIHPVVCVLRKNEDTLRLGMDSLPKVNGQWYKVSRNVLEQVCETMRSYYDARLCMPPPAGPLR